jgi:hypothetical protein
MFSSPINTPNRAYLASFPLGYRFRNFELRQAADRYNRLPINEQLRVQDERLTAREQLRGYLRGLSRIFPPLARRLNSEQLQVFRNDSTDSLLDAAEEAQNASPASLTAQSIRRLGSDSDSRLRSNSSIRRFRVQRTSRRQHTAPSSSATRLSIAQLPPEFQQQGWPGKVTISYD